MLTDLVDDVEPIIFTYLDSRSIARVAQLSTAARALAEQEQAKRIPIDFPEFYQLEENSKQSALSAYSIFKQASKLFTPDDYRLVKKYFPDCTWEQAISFFQLAYAEVPNINTAILIMMRLAQAVGDDTITSYIKIVQDHFTDKSQDKFRVDINWYASTDHPWAQSFMNLPKKIFMDLPYDNERGSSFGYLVCCILFPHLINLVLDDNSCYYSTTDEEINVTTFSSLITIIKMDACDETLNVYKYLYNKVRELHPKPPPACHPQFTADW